MRKRSEMSAGDWYLKADDRPIQPGWAVAPTSIELKGGVMTGLFVPSEEHPEGLRLVEISKKVMNQFIWLRKAGDEEIFRFASQHGLLGVNRWRKLGKFGEFSEPCDGWREYAREAYAIFEIAGHIKGNHPGPSEQWAVLESKGYFELKRYAASDAPMWARMQEERNRLAEAVNCWIAWGGLRPYLDWWAEKEQWRMSLIGADERGGAKAGIMGALARQMVIMLAEVEAFAICSHCSQSYLPDRTPTPKRRNFCQECRAKGVPNRISAREHRESQRKKGRR